MHQETKYLKHEMTDRGATEARVHRRQFFFTDSAIECPQGWIDCHVGAKYRLLHCPELAKALVTDANARTWALLGNAFPIDEGDEFNPVRRLGATRTESVPDIVTGWAGRWLLLSEEGVITDAAGLLGAYVFEGDTHVSISGSLALLSELEGVAPRDNRLIGWYGINWYPGPLSKLRQVRRLLPDQIYNPTSRNTTFFNRLTPERAVSKETAARAISAGLRNCLQFMQLAEPAKPILLALTAGLDSRTSLAVLLKARLPFSAITLEHERISRADRNLPPAISERESIKHSFYPAGALNAKRLEEYDRHVMNCVVDGDRQFYAHSAYERVGNAWLIRSGCWELGREYFKSKLSGLELEEVFEYPERLSKRFHTYAQIGPSAESISLWAKWRLEHAVAAPWHDLFYRDQRLAGWLSAIEQSLDLIDATSLHPANCDYVYRLLLEANRSECTDGKGVQETIIGECVPELAGWPVNPGSRLGLTKALKRINSLTAMMSGESRNMAMAVKRSIASGQSAIGAIR